MAISRTISFKLAGITFTTADKIMFALDCELEFDLIKKDVSDICK